MNASKTCRLESIGKYAWAIAFIFFFSSQGIRADWLQDLEGDTLRWMQEAQIPGMSIAIVENDTVIYAKGFGHLREDPASPLVDANTVFDIGSLSKAFTATQLAMLVDGGLLHWTDPVKDHLDMFKMRVPWVNKQFQVEDLLCHRSGLTWYSLFAMPFLGYSSADQVKSIGFKMPVTSFRSSFAYQNHMYIAASKLIEAKTGLSWQQHLAENIFKPLGMTRSIASERAKRQLPNVATGHMLLVDGQLWPIPRNWVNSFLVDNVLGAGAIKSSAMDMATWIRFNLNLGKWGGAQLVSQDNMRSLQAPKVLQAPWVEVPDLPHPGPVSYGAGWQYFSTAPQPFITHDGTEMGYKTNILIIPGAKAGIVILSNIGANFTDNHALNTRPAVIQKISFDFYHRYVGNKIPESSLDAQVQAFQSLMGPPAQRSAKMALVASEKLLASYVGVYFNPAFGQFKISMANRRLMISMGPRAISTALTPVGANEFRAYLPGYPAGSQMYLPFNFAFPETGPATMTIPAVAGWPQDDVFVRMD